MARVLLAGLVAVAGAGWAPAARAATGGELLRRHAPVLVLDARERAADRARAPGPVAVDAFLRGARGPRAWAAPRRVYGHAVRDGGRLWLQYWLFYPDNPQDRGIVRTGRHEGDWEMLQVGLGRAARPEVVTFAQHHWREACAWRDVQRSGAAPVAYVAHASHATYARAGTVDRPWPDPDDEVRGDGPRVRPPVTVLTDARPAWVRSPLRWGASRARWWIPGEQSSPLGPRYQADRRWFQPAAYHADARPCGAGAPFHPWYVVAIVLAVALAALAAVRWLAAGARRAHA